MAVSSSLLVFITAALLCAAAAFWVLRAYRRADANAKPAPILITTIGVIAATLVLYVVIGRPELAGQAFASRLAVLAARDPSTFTAEEALAVLSQAARDDPRDPMPLIYSGQVLMQVGEDRQAAQAFESALRRDPQKVEAMLGLGRALVSADGGRVSPEAQEVFERAGALTNDPAPWIYQAMAAMQNGRDMRTYWREALARMAPDDPRREMATRMAAGATQ